VFDQPYPFAKYDQVYVPEFTFGAMENPGCVTFSEHYLFRGKVTDAERESRANTLLHEMAHMWFGDLVTMRWWDDLWLNESFATYIGTRALAEATRFTDAWAAFGNSTKAWALAQDQLPSTHPISADITDTDAIRTHFDGITYAKGASVLSQLVAWVGDEAFFSGLRDYFERHAFGNATLADFLAALEKGSGRDLTEWSAEWLETAGVAILRPELELDDGRYRRAAIVQEAPAEHARTVDVEEPESAVTGGPADPTNETSASLSFSGSDNLDTSAQLSFECRLDGAAFEPCTSPVEYVGLADGEHAFQTPLASLHRHNGWADRFLVTPDDGLQDSFAGIGTRMRDWDVTARFHDFRADNGGARYGREFNASVGRQFGDNMGVELKLARFQGNDGWDDATKFWLSFTAGWSGTQ
jgi:hypothetical protein